MLPIIPARFTITIFMLATMSVFISCNTKQDFPKPTEGEENENQLEQYFEFIHRADPNTDWHAIERKNAADAFANRQNLLRLNGQSKTEYLANNQLIGQWNERGSNNLAGNVKAMDYVPSTGALYLISAGGTLWKGTITGSNWTILNQNIRCRPDILKVILNKNGAPRILVSFDNKVEYSDNDGQTFSPATGIDFLIESSKNRIVSITPLIDKYQTIYCVTRSKEDTASAVLPSMLLYRSIDLGASFEQIYRFPPGEDTASLSVNKPYNSNHFFALDTKTNTGRVTMFSILDGKLSVLKTSGDVRIPKNASCILKGFSNGTKLTQYLMVGNTAIWQTTDTGATWIAKDTLLPEKSWDRLDIGSNANTLFIGRVNAYRSVDGGTTWTTVNDWTEYYGNASQKLHADIMDIASFKNPDNRPFTITSTHGGSYVSYDDLATNTNLSLSGLNTGQFYDVLSDQDNTNNIYGGSQDQGFQRALKANSSNGPLIFSQAPSGDYTSLTFSGSPKHLWVQAPQGYLDYYVTPDKPDSVIESDNTFKVPGKQLPNTRWMLPVANTGKNRNEVYVGGGNIKGDTGSYLIKLAPAETPPYEIASSQFDYNFRLNSTTRKAGISAIAADKTDDKNIYVGAEDGTFFYSNDDGTNWNITESFNGPKPIYLYGGAILSSKVSPGTVWYGGSGYSNPPVYVSTDAGKSFTDMSDGLPSTFVHRFAANPDESMLFAATDAGPYVYIVADKKWYPMLGLNAPVQNYTSVEYITSSNTVRFGTFGRGIWDFVINTVLPANMLAFNAALNGNDVQLNWSITNTQDLTNMEVQRSYDAYSFTGIATVKAINSAATVQQYGSIDNNPFSNGHNVIYYRIKLNSKNGTTKYSVIKAVRSSNTNVVINAWPNPVKDFIRIELNLPAQQNVQLVLADINGRILYNVTKLYTQGNSNESLPVNNLLPGMYLLNAKGNGWQKTIKIIKQ